MESQLNEENASLIRSVILDAAECIGVSIINTSPKEIVKQINECVRQIQQGIIPDELKGQDVEVLLGCLWGSQFVRAFGWEWVNIDTKDICAIAVVSPSRSMVVYPLNYVAACVTCGAENAILLAFNMLNEREGDMIYAPASYEDIMQHIYHIVPPT